MHTRITDVSVVEALSFVFLILLGTPNCAWRKAGAAWQFADGMVEGYGLCGRVQESDGSMLALLVLASSVKVVSPVKRFYNIIRSP
jgi:hypothetical protein